MEASSRFATQLRRTRSLLLCSAFCGIGDEMCLLNMYPRIVRDSSKVRETNPLSITDPVYRCAKLNCSPSDGTFQCCCRKILPLRYPIPYSNFKRPSRLDALRRMFTAYSLWLLIILDKLIEKKTIDGNCGRRRGGESSEETINRS